MAVPLTEPQLLQVLAQLTSEQQRRVLDYARSLGDKHLGTPGKDLLHFVGLFSPGDLAEMTEALKGCEHVDTDEW